MGRSGPEQGWGCLHSCGRIPQRGLARSPGSGLLWAPCPVAACRWEGGGRSDACSRLPPQVKVMLRVWPAQGAQRSAESTSFLKVDPRKKQVTLYDPAAGPPGSTGPRRAATTAVPKMFAFDAVFPQDSEQVRGWVSSGLGQGSSGPRGQTCASVPARGEEPGGPRGAARGRPAAFPFPLTPALGRLPGSRPGSQAKSPFPGEEPARLGAL